MSNNKYNPIKICSCQTCRSGNSRRYYFKVANKKLRKINTQLKTLVDYDNLDRLLIAGGYTD